MNAGERALENQVSNMFKNPAEIKVVAKTRQVIASQVSVMIWPSLLLVIKGKLQTIFIIWP